MKQTKMSCNHPLVFLRLSILFFACKYACAATSTPSTMKHYFEEEQRLHNDLFNKDKGYEATVRPALNASGSPVGVKMGFAPISIVELNTKDQILRMNAWMRFSWVDKRLTWDPADYGGIQLIRTPWHKIWRPDISLYNSESPDSFISMHDDLLGLIYSDGTILLIPPAVLKSTCNVDLTLFPFDTQTCSLKFGSWAYSGYEVDLGFYEGRKAADLADYNMDSEWELISTSAKRNEKYYPCCTEPYPDIVFNMIMKRRGQFLIYCSPAIMLTLMIPLVFLAPHGTGDKSALGFCIQFCLLLLITSMEDFFMAFRMPLLVSFYVYSFILVGVSLFITALINIVFCSCSKPPPSALTGIANKLGGFLCVSGSSDKSDSFALVDPNGTTDQNPDLKVRAQWTTIATLIDRVMFIIFLVIVACLTGIMIGGM